MNKHRSFQLVVAATAAVLLLAQPLSFAQETPPASQGTLKILGIEFERIDFSLGHIFGNLKARNSGDLEILQLMVRLGKTINSWFGLEDHKGVLGLYLQPFISPIFSPESGVAIGTQIFFEYAYPLTEKLSFQTGFGSGPMYFGVDTIEEGSAGFNFYDSGKAGFSYQINENHRFFLEYHAVHISNLGWRDKNNGINAHGAVIGLTKKF